MKSGKIGASIGLMVFGFVIMMIFMGGGNIAFSMFPIFVFISVISIFAKYFKKNVTDLKHESQESHNDNEYEEDKYKVNEPIKKPSKREKNTQISKASIRCKKCNALIDAEERYCPECGTPKSDTVICRDCGHVNPATNALCEKCNGFLY